jgi:hypothetical protein
MPGGFVLRWKSAAELVSNYGRMPDVVRFGGGENVWVSRGVVELSGAPAATRPVRDHQRRCWTRQGQKKRKAGR